MRVVFAFPRGGVNIVIITLIHVSFTFITGTMSAFSWEAMIHAASAVVSISFFSSARTTTFRGRETSFYSSNGFVQAAFALSSGLKATFLWGVIDSAHAFSNVFVTRMISFSQYLGMNNGAVASTEILGTR
jgi:hypothetical protein